MSAERGLPDDIVHSVKRIAHEITRASYGLKRDELMQLARIAIANGADVSSMLDGELRQALSDQIPRDTHPPAHARHTNPASRG